MIAHLIKAGPPPCRPRRQTRGENFCRRRCAREGIGIRAEAGAAWAALRGRYAGGTALAPAVCSGIDPDTKLGPGPGHLAVHSFLSSSRDLCYRGISQRRLVARMEDARPAQIIGINGRGLWAKGPRGNSMEMLRTARRKRGRELKTARSSPSTTRLPDSGRHKK